jgi:hypothetical protein
MDSIDRRGRLKEEPFTFRVTKDGKVFIHWHGKQVMILKGTSTDEFIASITHVDSQQAQLLMAKSAGHFKHGNER